MTPGYTSYVGWVPEDTQIFLCCSKFEVSYCSRDMVVWLGIDYGYIGVGQSLRLEVQLRLTSMKSSCKGPERRCQRSYREGAGDWIHKLHKQTWPLEIRVWSCSSKYMFDHAANQNGLMSQLYQHVSISFNMSQHALDFARFHEARKPHIVSSPVPRLCRVKSRVEWAHPSHLAALRSVGHVVQGCGAAVLSWDSWHVETGLPESLFKSNISNCTESFIHAFLVGSELPWMQDLARNQERRGQAAIQIKHIPLGELQAMPWRPKTWGVADDWGDNISQMPGDIQSPHTIT